MSNELLSVRALLDIPLQQVLAERGAIAMIRDLCTGLDLLDAFLQPHLESAATEIVVSPADLTPDEVLRPLVVRAIVQLPKNFAEWEGSTPAGERVRDMDFWLALRAARGDDGSAPESDIAVTVRFDLDILRQAADPQPHHERQR
jgi:hypothetical protein